MAVDAKAARTAFDPGAFRTFKFAGRHLDAGGVVRLRYALDDAIEFEETVELPVERAEGAAVDGLLSLLHWVAGVSYFKTAAPPEVAFDDAPPPPAAARLLAALYSEGLAEFAYRNGLPVPEPDFGPTDGPAAASASTSNDRVLVPIGGGKDSVVALELVRRAGVDATLFSVGDAPPIARTAAVAALPHLVARRRLDPRLRELNASGALNGHVPVTAIVSCIAALTAALRGLDAVVMANERSASAGSLVWDGVEVNHQFSKSLRAELLLRDAVSEAGGPHVFSILRPASELAIARAFARLEPYHRAFTSCNRVFRLDPAARASSWCCDCDKCRFVFLALAPFSEPEHLREVFGHDLLDDPSQLDGFALLAAKGGPKPLECVGEEEESAAAIRLLAGDARWRGHAVVRRLANEVLPEASPGADVLALSDEHAVPDRFLPHVRAVLGA